MTKDTRIEQILKKLGFEGVVEKGTHGFKDVAYLHLDDLFEFCEAYHQSKLQALREEVEKLEEESELLTGVWQDEFNEGFNDACNKILNLIDNL